MKQSACLAAVLLWVIVLAIAGWFFVKGWTTTGSDGRVEILLAAAERDQVLGDETGRRQPRRTALGGSV